MIQTCGSYSGSDDSYSVSIANDGLCFTLDGLSRSDVESIGDLALCLLFDEREPPTWHYDFEPNDVF